MPVVRQPLFPSATKTKQSLQLASNSPPPSPEALGPRSLSPCFYQKKTATSGRPFPCLPQARLSRRVLHLLGVHVEVRVDTLHVVQILERFQQTHHLPRRIAL